MITFDEYILLESNKISEQLLSIKAEFLEEKKRIKNRYTQLLSEYSTEISRRFLIQAEFELEEQLNEYRQELYNQVVSILLTEYKVELNETTITLRNEIINLINRLIRK